MNNLINSLLNNVAQSGHPMMQNLMGKINNNDTQGIHNMANNLLNGLPNDQRSQQIRQMYANGDINGLLSLLKK